MATTANQYRLSSKILEYSAKDKNSSDMKLASQVIIDHYRCPEEFVNFGVLGHPSEHAGFFRFGPATVCYGRCSAFEPSFVPEYGLNDALEHVSSDQNRIFLPFDLSETVSALRYERYVCPEKGGGKKTRLQRIERAVYYAIRPLMPVAVRKHLQRFTLRNWGKRVFPHWPVDTSVESALAFSMALSLRARNLREIPFIWFWPDGAQACAVMTHDVETSAGRDFCDRLMTINDSYGIKASFQIIPEQRYAVPDSYLKGIKDRGCEVNVHDLNHDGKLFLDYEEFRRRAAAINEYGKAFGAIGFRSAVLYRNIDWFELLDFQYDMSIPNVGHLDPQHGGCCTTFPYFVGEILEIPVTLTQDYSLFNILCDFDIDLWEKQISMILGEHGVMNFIVHPDYILKEPNQSVYRNLLSRLSCLRETAGVWLTLPGKLNEWWRKRNEMRLIRDGSGWKITGDGSERARIARAVLENDVLVYKF